MSLLKVVRDTMWEHATNGVEEAKQRYKNNIKECTVISLVVFVICALSLLLKAFVF